MRHHLSCLNFLRTALGLVTASCLFAISGCSQPDPVEQAGTAYKQAHDLLERSHPDQAIPYYNTAIRLNPKFVAAYNERGRAWLLAGDKAKSTADFDQAIELDPHYAEARCNRGLNRIDSGDLSGALEDLNAAIQANPKLTDAYINRGLLHSRRDEFKEAIDDFASAIDLSPDDPTIYCNRADARARMPNKENAKEKDLDGAYADYSKAIELGEKQRDGKTIAAVAYNGRGLISATRHKYAEAISDFNRAIDRDPKLVAAYINRGDARESINELPSALDDLNKAVALDSQYAPAYLTRGDVKLALNRPQDALDDFDRAIKLNPSLPRAYDGRGRAQRSLAASENTAKGLKDLLTAALGSFDKALALDAQFVEAYSHRALTKRDLAVITGNLDTLRAAISDCSQAIDLRSNQAGLFLNRGAIHLAFGDAKLREAAGERKLDKQASDQDTESAKAELKLAIDDFTQAAKIDDKTQRVYQLRGEAKRFSGDLNGAIEDFTLQLRMSPDPLDASNAFNNRALAKQEKDDRTGALDDYEKAIEANRRNWSAYFNRGLLRLEIALESGGRELEAQQDFQLAFEFAPEARRQDLENRIEMVRQAFKAQPKVARPN